MGCNARKTKQQQTGIGNEYIAFLNVIASPLTLMGDRVIWLSYSDSTMSKLQ
jgi:hypothetical protein